MADQNNIDETIEVKEGVIGYFDILGFKNYIKNDPDVGSKNALEVILKVRTEVPKKTKQTFLSNEIFDDVTWTVLSDTIVLSVPYPPKKAGEDLEQENNEKAIRWAALLFSSIVLMDYMFDQGLPIRGAISNGKYFANSNSLAGKSIVEALTLAERLNLSAVAICPEAEKELTGILDLKTLVKEIWHKQPAYFSYLTPLKDKMDKLCILNQWALHDKYTNSDIPQLVAQAFWKHGKDIDMAAFQKYQNTEMLLRYLVAMKREWKN